MLGAFAETVAVQEEADQILVSAIPNPIREFIIERFIWVGVKKAMKWIRAMLFLLQKKQISKFEFQIMLLSDDLESYAARI